MNRDAIQALLPHAGPMCLLDRVDSWDAESIAAGAVSHLDPRNPLRRRGRLPAVCGIEYALQAAALHGALLDGAPHPPGMLAALKDVTLVVTRLDDAAIGRLAIGATRLLRTETGLIYAFALRSAAGAVLLEGQATVIVPPGVIVPPPARAAASPPPTGGAA